MIALQLPLAIERGAAARQAIPCLGQRVLRLVMSRLCLAIAAGGLLALRLGFAHRRVQPGEVLLGRGAGEVVELRQQGCRRPVQLVLFGLDGGALLGKRTDLGGQAASSARASSRPPTRLEVAARRFARALCRTEGFPDRLRGQLRRRQPALGLDQAILGRCTLSPQLEQAGALLRRAAAVRPGRVGARTRPSATTRHRG